MTLLRPLTALFLTVALLSCGAAAQEPPFSDVGETHWAAESIYWCERYGLMEGVGGGRFGLGEPMTRAAYAATLCRMMKWEQLTPEEGSFKDNQNPKAWYYSAVETAYAHGVLTAHSDLCRPNEPITREEMAMMTVRALGFSLLAGTVQEHCPFTDVSVGAGYITLAYCMGIVKGVDRYTFNPKATATREEAAAMLLRAYNGWMDGIQCYNEAEFDGVTHAVASRVGESGTVPLSPRASYEDIFAAVLTNKPRTDGSFPPLLFNLAPYAQSVKDGVIGEGRELAQSELEACLAADGTRSYRSARHGSSYLLSPEEDGSTTVVWYVSSEDLHDKLTLAKLLGVESVVLRRPALTPAE